MLVLVIVGMLIGIHFGSQSPPPDVDFARTVLRATLMDKIEWVEEKPPDFSKMSQADRERYVSDHFNNWADRGDHLWKASLPDGSCVKIYFFKGDSVGKILSYYDKKGFLVDALDYSHSKYRPYMKRISKHIVDNSDLPSLSKATALLKDMMKT